jgi:phage terminase large subunit-like protein
VRRYLPPAFPPGTVRARLLAMSDHDRAQFLARMAPEDRRALAEDWEVWAEPGQRPPPGDWRLWLILAGRGFGKTRAGAAWVNRIARARGARRIALVAATLDEGRAVMVEGPAGVLATAETGLRPDWQPSLGRLRWKTGAEARLYSADAPDGLRGPEHGYAWCDELAKWGRAEECWTNLTMGLRAGRRQRAVVTTTPRPMALLERLIAAPGTVVTRGRTWDNPHLADGFLSAMTALFGGTARGRQELDGELLRDAEDALWTRAGIEAARATGALPPPVRVVIGVDPPASAKGVCGIVAAGRLADGRGVVLADASVPQAVPERWAAAVAACARAWQADRVVAEANNGGEMVRAVLAASDPNLPIELVHAARGKAARAEPAALLYAQGRVVHAGRFPELEAQLCGFTIGGGWDGADPSPDRADALVWALDALFPRRADPRLRRL